MELLKNLEGMSADEQMTAVVELQKAAMKTLEEQKQVSIGKSAEMVILGLKKIKADFETKFDSLNYDIQTKVANLKDGQQGIQGQKGEQGDRGLDGAQGRDGKSGLDGKNGLDGKDGISVQDAKIDFDGSLVITLSDGREINVGEVVPVDVAQTIHKIQSGSGGDSQTTLNAIAALQATIATYGTMATQNKTSVDIEGGTIDNTVIGGTTPAAGTFTTLTATGQTSLGGAAGSEGLRITTTASAANYLLGRGQISGNNPSLRSAGSDTNVSLLLGSQNAGNIRFLTNSLNDEQLRISHTASAVNYVQVTGAATGSAPSVAATGSDASVPLIIAGKGGSSVSFQTNGVGSSVQFLITHTSAVANYVQTTGSTTGFGAKMFSAGTDTNIPLVLQPKGTGALQAQQTDSTATGGNARGANAVDWQMQRNAANQVANGAYSVICGGGSYGSPAGNSAGGTACFTGGGWANTSGTQASAVVGGNNNSATALNTFIGGGGQNSAIGQAYSSVVGGNANTSNGFFNFVGGGAVNSGTSSSAVTTQSATMNGTTAVTLSGSNASIKVGQLITGTSIASYTYVAAISGTSLTLSQAASGSSTSTLSFYTPHGVVVGGGNNQATGSYSFIGGGGDAGSSANRNVASGDWSTVGGGIKNTASGVGSFVGGGGFNTASIVPNTASGILSSILGGGNNTASSNYSSVVGYQSTANGTFSSCFGAYGSTRGITGNMVFSPSFAPISSTAGTQQTALLVLGKQTTDATASVLTSDGGAGATTNQVILPNNSGYYFKGSVIANVTGGGNTKAWAIEGAIKRGANAASTALVGTPTVTSSYADAGASTWDITATADTTNGGLKITFTGQASTTIRCVAKLETTEVTF